MDLEEKLARLPDHPGVYLMRDAKGEIIYVGKAASLKNRVRSYFRGQHPPRTQVLVSHIADFEYILTDNEVEALILECNLIKEHRPRYNVSLKDDKSYPYIKITTQEQFPRLQITRSLVRDGSRYFGPYTNVGALRETLKILRGLFPVRTCRETPLQHRSRPCLNAHINRCLAPCSGKVNPEAYREAVDNIVLFLEGKHTTLVKELKEQMEAAAGRLEFEKAARLRDQLRAVQEVCERQKLAAASGEDADAVAFAREGEAALGLIFFSRGGKVIGRDHFFLTGTEGLSRGEIMAALLKEYYSRGVEIPPQILLHDEPDDAATIARWLGRLRGGRVELKVPKRGSKLKLLQLVHENAVSLLQEHLLARRRQEEGGKAALMELQQALGLPRLPRRMEAYDISNFQGSSPVGAMAVFVDGRPLTSAYRRFQIKTVKGPNDFASLQEVLSRRFRRAAGQDPRFAELPDFVLIDGGLGQLHAAREVMAAMGVAAIPTFALAKEEELLFREGSHEPVRLPRDSRALQLLQYLRDEVHRFAITYHRQKREKGAYRSVLDDIPGVGPKRKKALLRHFGSVAKIREATLDELMAVEGMNRAVAVRILEGLGRKNNGENPAGSP
ncbi:excinuclease ABC subunit UvrC [Neomoorella mulderi]|uniref:UvrABC system protein C n=1 Tax=Moorella mulderi DSM 14980 TaxID=1122241 RepID=A0A151AV17_9FIRM|nr:excinuclease ABC subunit UvrC [Moorella mulderi]KYH31509.1 UvrABC system protein C [Moorella mulderi DSM 14980]